MLNKEESWYQPISVKTTLVLCLMAAMLGAGGCYALMRWNNQSIASKLREIDGIVAANYVGEVDEKEIGDYMATGYIAALDDRWSYYVPQEQYEASFLRSQGQVYGIGVSVMQSETEIRVRQVYEDSPAKKAGIEKGDLILAADTSTIENDGVQAVMDVISGEQASVSLKVQKASTDAVETVSVEYALIKQTLAHGQMLSNNVGYVRIEGFNAGANEQFGVQLETLLTQGAEKLVIDVRHNGGGRVSEMSDILDRFLGEGTIITLREKDGDETVYASDAASIDIPLVVLVDEESISAAEFFGACLQEYGRATLVGVKTIGKGRAQQMFELSDGSAINISVEQYYTPNGENLADKGIVPDVEVPLSQAQQDEFYFLSMQNDPQVQKAMEILS